MDCPRCGERLTTFALGDTQATVCESCEYVGIPTDHHPESRGDTESWDDVLERFFTDAGDPSGGPSPAPSDGREAGTDDSTGG